MISSLERAAILFSRPDSLCKGVLYDGEPDPATGEFPRYCVLGAMLPDHTYRTVDPKDALIYECDVLLEAANDLDIRYRTPYVWGGPFAGRLAVSQINNHPATTLADVRAWLARALEIARDRELAPV